MSQPGPAWWHVSAYADYDLVAARKLGLTCVFVGRPHARRGDPALADVVVADLAELAALLVVADGADAEDAGCARAASRRSATA